MAKKKMMTVQIDKDLIDAAEFARVAGISTGNTYLLRHKGIVDVVRVGRAVLFSRKQAKALARERATWGTVKPVKK